MSTEQATLATIADVFEKKPVLRIAEELNESKAMPSITRMKKKHTQIDTRRLCVYRKNRLVFDRL